MLIKKRENTGRRVARLLNAIPEIRFSFFILAMISLLIFSAKADAKEPQHFDAEMNIDKILVQTPSGTPARVENEFKLIATLPPELAGRNTYILGKIRSDLERHLANDLKWKVPALSNSEYYIMQTGMGTFCFLDIYLDTDENLNFKNNISYRVRYRWHSRGALIRYILGSRNPADFPHRCEYQLKIYLNEWKNGFNNCEETRFEFRNESFPFKTDKSAPPPPWPFKEFVNTAIIGQYNNFTTWPSFEYATFLKQKLGLSGLIKLKPSLIVVTTRRRLHLGIKNEFGLVAAELGMGSAINADQAILMTLDTSEIYNTGILATHFYSLSAQQRNSLTARLQKRLKASLLPEAVFTEMEFEFERNIESSLAHCIKNASTLSEAERLKEYQNAFLSDVQTTSRIVAEAIGKIGIKTSSGTESKYQQAWKALFINRGH